MFTIVTNIDYGWHRTFHLMFMFRFGVVAFLAQIEIIARRAMVTDFALLPACVAIVGELVRR